MDDTTLRKHLFTASTEDDAYAAATIIAEAFSALPVCHYLVPNPRDRVSVLRDAFMIDVAHAMERGTVDLLTQVSDDQCIGGGAGAAVWIDRTRPVEDPEDYDRRLKEATGTHYDRFVKLDLLFTEHHPDGSHHHLALLATAPGSQHTGIGTALLRHHHELLDLHGIDAYLEASNPDSARLYQRHGYERSGRDFFLVPDAGFIPMMRIRDRERNG